MDNRRLDSWKEIASYLSRDVRTVIRWEKERGLPVHRVPGGRKNAVFAFTRTLDSWLLADAAPAESRLLAVLPFDNGTGDAGVDYLCDGLTESLINRLAQSPQIRVMARSTVFRYRGPGVNVREAGRSLGVPVVVAGVVRQERDAIAVSAELVNTRTGSQLWGSRYVQSTPDLWAFEPQIAGAIAEELRLQLTPAQSQSLTRESTRNSEAMRLYWRGRQAFQNVNEESFNEAMRCYQQAIALDPAYARAHAALAELYGFLSLGYSAERPALEFSRLAQASARAALSFDPSLGEAHCALGLALAPSFDLGQIETHFRRAIELQPSHALARSLYAYARLCRGDREAAMLQADRAVELDPTSLVIQTDAAAIHAYAGDLERAQELMEPAQQAFAPPGAPLPGWMYVTGLIHQLRGEHDRAIDVLERATRVNIMHTVPLGILGYCYAKVGNSAGVTQTLERLAGLPPERHTVHFSRAIVFAGLGQTAQALEALERACEEKNPWLFLLKIAPWFEGIRSHPRLQAIVARLAL